MKILIIIPVYNEQRNITNVISELNNYAHLADYMVINDCSTDHTLDILNRDKIDYLNLPVNLGIGGGVQVGYKYAKDNGYDIAIQFDGDGQHIAKYIENLIKPIEEGNADIVIGSRFIENEGFQSSWQRRMGINFLSSLIRGLSGVKIRDVTSGLRAVNKKYIEVYANEYAQDYPEPEALMHAAILGATIKEIPVRMRERQNGVSSIKASKSIYYMIKVSLAIILHRITFQAKSSGVMSREK